MTQRAPVVFLHVGAMKTGTTYLQQMLIRNKENLAAHGFLFPGATWGDQVRAAHDAVGHHRERRVRERARGSWKAVREEMLGHDGAASVLSVEFLSFGGPGEAQHIADDLAAAEVHVILTVRDTCTVLPGLWQTHCANGGTASWPAFARSARVGAGTGRVAPLVGQGSRLFRRALDIPRILDSWAAVVSPERLHVVTVPRSGSARELLWERFTRVLGLDPALATSPAQGHNPSLGYPSADLMRRLNAELGRLPRADYNPTLKHYLAERVLSERADAEPRASLDARTYDFALRWNRRTRAEVEASGAHVVGDLEDLPVTAAGSELPDTIEPPDPDEVVAAAAHALKGINRLVERRTQRLHRLGADLFAEPSQEHHFAGWVTGWARHTDPVHAAVLDLADACRIAVARHQRIRELRG